METKADRRARALIELERGRSLGDEERVQCALLALEEAADETPVDEDQAEALIPGGAC